ncbi:efflux RND transporter periplasmic adaptor subunit [Deinococcus sp. Marseille-Q6407]|uniref:efflux RND transporter periplasmic adaptor subunit n=1 Tax=Deinococcus sp. Marseille-Q6407 TaxID=2969223 RepID=UPI0021BE0EC9|nr:efflux RND transporter periplasmic adaptor subunit [Deinococcus sp. Marseille-Q6407]
MNRFRLSSVLLLSALLPALGGCRPAEPAAEPAPRVDVSAPPPKVTAQPVQVLVAERGALRAERRVTGSAEASRTSSVAALTSGALLGYDVAEGQSVAAGGVVARLDDTDARQAVQNARAQLEQARISEQSARQSLSENAGALEAAVTAAQSSLDLSQRELRRAEDAGDATPAAQLEAARDRVTQARAGLAQAQAQLAANRAGTGGTGANLELLRSQVQSAQAAVTQAEDRLGRARVTAPFAGVVSKQLVQPGEFAAQGSPVFRLVDASAIRAAFSVPPQDAAQLSPGTRMNLGYGGTNYVAVVEGGERIAGEDRQVPLRARIQGGRDIPLGASVQIRYRLELADGVLVPSRAINVSGAENYVYVAEGGVARRVPVTVQAESDGRVAVSGLPDGARLIYPVPSSLRDGSKVQVQPAARAAAASGTATEGGDS